MLLQGADYWGVRCTVDWTWLKWWIMVVGSITYLVFRPVSVEGMGARSPRRQQHTPRIRQRHVANWLADYLANRLQERVAEVSSAVQFIKKRTLQVLFGLIIPFSNNINIKNQTAKFFLIPTYFYKLYCITMQNIPIYLVLFN